MPLTERAHQALELAVEELGNEPGLLFGPHTCLYQTKQAAAKALPPAGASRRLNLRSARCRLRRGG